MDEYQEYLRLFGDLPFGMRPDFDTYKKQVSAQTARDTLTQGIAEGDLDKAYKEGFEKLPLMDQLLYGVAPVTGEALATYEIPEFKERGDTARKEGRKLDAAGNYLVSGLNLLSMVPVVGKTAGLVDDAVRILGRGTRAKTQDGMGGGAKLPPPTSTPTAFETQITAGIKNNENVYTSRPATTVIEESVVNNPKFKNLIDIVTDKVNLYAKELRSSYNYTCGNSWFNIYKKGDYQEYHYHSNSHFSAIFVLQTPEPCPVVTFENPLPDMLPLKNLEICDINAETYHVKDMKENCLLVFRSYLRHMVSPLQKDGERISIAFNF